MLGVEPLLCFCKICIRRDLTSWHLIITVDPATRRPVQFAIFLLQLFGRDLPRLGSEILNFPSKWRVSILFYLFIHLDALFVSGQQVVIVVWCVLHDQSVLNLIRLEFLFHNLFYLIKQSHIFSYASVIISLLRISLAAAIFPFTVLMTKQQRSKLPKPSSTKMLPILR